MLIFSKQKMKKQTLFLGAALIFAALSLQSCNDDDRVIGEPWSHIEGLTSTGWILSEVSIIDEANPSRPTRSLSKFFTTGDDLMTLNFSSDGDFVSVPGQGGQVFPLSGTWSFDLDEAPRRINMLSDGEVFVANLGAPVRPVDQRLLLELVTRTCTVNGEEKPVIGYRFVFDRQN